MHVGINGMGRIGRLALRAVRQLIKPDKECVVNSGPWQQQPAGSVASRSGFCALVELSRQIAVLHIGQGAG